jgi:hypothetical protein
MDDDCTAAWHLLNGFFDEGADGLLTRRYDDSDEGRRALARLLSNTENR